MFVHAPVSLNVNVVIFDKPVSIDNLKRFVTDYIYKNRIKIPAPTIEKREEKIAIIGAGPAGLTAANDLAGMGYQVTVFEKESRVGGMMMWAIPSYRLPRDQIMFDVSNIEARGVEIKLNTHFGSPDKTISGLLEEGYSAVFSGCWRTEREEAWRFPEKRGQRESWIVWIS